MARKRYRSFRSPRRFRRPRKIAPAWRLGILALVIIVVAVFFFTKNGPEIAPASSLPEEIPLFEPIPRQTSQPKPEEKTPEPSYVAPKPKPILRPVAPAPSTNKTVAETNNITSPEAKALIESAINDIKAGNIVTARDKLNKTLVPPMKLSSKLLPEVKKQLAALADKWLFSRTPYPADPFTAAYKVQSGDMLSEIGKSYNIPYELIMSINDIKRPEALAAGKTIKVINGPFHAVVHRSTFTLDLYIGKNTYVKTYRVGLGELGKETPTGLWLVKTNGKLIRPPWPNPAGGIVYPDDPEYPLGSRWIGLKGLEGQAKGRTGFGIHGTKDPATIGTRSSQGCIRLYNGQAIELYDLLTPGLSKVRVVD